MRLGWWKLGWQKRKPEAHAGLLTELMGLHSKMTRMQQENAAKAIFPGAFGADGRPTNREEWMESLREEIRKLKAENEELRRGARVDELSLRYLAYGTLETVQYDYLLKGEDGDTILHVVVMLRDTYNKLTLTKGS